MEWWSWLILGLVLIGVELITPGSFFVLFFGLGAILVGTILFLFGAMEVWLQWCLFAVISVATLALLRPKILHIIKRGDDRHDRSSMVGELAMVTATIAPGQIGQVEARGTVWAARNTGTATLTVGTRARVISVQGLELQVEEA